MSQQGNRRSRRRPPSVTGAQPKPPVEAPSSSASATSPSGGGARSRERREEQKREKRRQQRINTGIIIGVIVAVIVALFLLVRAPADAPIPDTAAARYADISTSRLPERGYPVLGDPDTRVKVTLYSSFDSTESRLFHNTIMDELIARVRAGRIVLFFAPVSGVGQVVNGRGAAVVAVCSAEQERFWQMHDTLFAWQGEFGNQAFTNNRLIGGLDALGLDQSRYNNCRDTGRADEVLNTATQEAQALLNFAGVPAVAINGVVSVDEDGRVITNAVDVLAAIDREVERLAQIAVTPQPEVTADPEATPEATVEPETTPEATVEPEGMLEATAEPEATPEATADA